MPRKEINFDDDELVERLIEREEIAREKKRDAAAKKHVAGKERSQVLAMVVKDVEVILQNIAAGNAPYPIHEAYIFVSDLDLDTASAVRVLAVQESRELTPDAEIFDSLCCDKLLLCMSDDLADLRTSKKFKTVEAAIPALVKVGITKKLIPAADKDRLTALFSIWMKGVDWTNTVKHGMNRPSLASWNGYPWDARVYKDRSLSHNTTSKIVEAVVDDEGPEEIVSPEYVCFFKRVWTKDEGPVKDIAAVLKLAIKEVEDLIAKEKAEKGSKKRRRT